jgi:hypothetical protein
MHRQTGVPGPGGPTACGIRLGAHLLGPYQTWSSPAALRCSCATSPSEPWLSRPRECLILPTRVSCVCGQELQAHDDLMSADTLACAKVTFPHSTLDPPAVVKRRIPAESAWRRHEEQMLPARATAPMQALPSLILAPSLMSALLNLWTMMCLA